MSKQIDGAEKSLQQIDQQLQSVIKQIGTADFGLDPKNPDQKKTIAATQKKLQGALADARSEVGDHKKMFADLNKTVASAGKSSNIA